MDTQTKSRTKFRWFVLTMIFLIYMVAGADRSNIGMVVPYIKDSFELTNTDIGAMSSFFYLTYAAVQIPAGHLYSKHGTRFLYALSIFFTSVATLIMGLANSGLQLKWARALLGLAEGPINIGSVSVINKWFPTQEKGIAMGLYLSSIKFAPAFVPPLCAWLIMTYGWRSVFYAFAVPGFFLTVLWYFFVRDNPRDSKFVNEAEVHYIENPVIPSVAEKKDATDNTSTSIGGTLDRLIRTRIVEPLANNTQILRSWNVWTDALGGAFGPLAVGMILDAFGWDQVFTFLAGLSLFITVSFIFFWGKQRKT